MDDKNGGTMLELFYPPAEYKYKYKSEERIQIRRKNGMTYVCVCLSVHTQCNIPGYLLPVAGFIVFV